MSTQNDSPASKDEAALHAAVERAFDERQCRQLAMLQVFGEAVNADVLVAMGSTEQRWSCPELKGLTREAAIGLLDRAVEVGLLDAVSGGQYTMPPSRAPLLARLFREHVSRRSVTAEAETDWRGTLAMRAFAEARDAVDGR